MCFSATASFTTAALTGAIGLVALVRAPDTRSMPLAAMPVLFALQQASEGFLWLTLPAWPASPHSGVLTVVFLLFAEVLWPVYAPWAVLMDEQEAMRRKVLTGLLVLGACVSLYFLARMLLAPHTASIYQGHIVYLCDVPLRHSVGWPYLAATGGALLISSAPAVNLLGLIVVVGSVAAYLFYWDAFISVWCFFAAAASIVLLGHFERQRRALAPATTSPER